MVNPTQLLVVVCLLLPTVFGCSCVYPPEYSTPLESLCRDYQWSSDVFAGRVISASCNCIPPLNDSSYGQANISCVSGSISEYFTSAVVAGATCDTSIQQYGLLSCDTILNRFKPIECPYEGQVYMDCAPLCPTTCSSTGVASPCQQPSVCVGGCACPEGMVTDEEQRRCVMPSQCPHKTCPVEGQVYTDCASSCPPTCDNVNDTIACDAACWQGCQCPSGTVIDEERRRCVEPSQCIRESPPIIARTSENGRCEQQFACPFNTAQNDFYLCQYILEVTEVYKGDNEVGQLITNYGPDLLTSCGNPGNILSVGTTYVVGIGGPCNAYGEWTQYSRYPTEHRQALSDGCSQVDWSSTENIYPFSLITLIAIATWSYCIS